MMKSELCELIDITIKKSVDLWIFKELFLGKEADYEYYKQFDNEISRMTMTEKEFQRVHYLLTKYYDW